MAAITSVVHGMGGQMSAAGIYTGFKNWVLTVTVNTININSLDDEPDDTHDQHWDQKSAGLRDWEATLDGFDMATSLGAVVGAIGTSGSFIFKETDGADPVANQNSYTAPGIIDSISKSVSVGDIITYSVHVVGNGEVVIGT